jgi:hypothetical protein
LRDHSAAGLEVADVGGRARHGLVLRNAPENRGGLAGIAILMAAITLCTELSPL